MPSSAWARVEQLHLSCVARNVVLIGALKETLELFAFMEAADESKRRGGAPVSIAEVIKANQPR